ncbi:MAG: Uma2 family endonuclease [Armatimonadota bacterium]
MAAQRKPLFSPEEYLDRERYAENKSEYIAGEILAMAGASLTHNRITLNLGGELRARLRGSSSSPFTSDLRVQVSAAGPYFFPDALIICSDPVFRDGREDTVLNPVVLIEVLSPSTEAYDRGEKFAYYRRMESLQEYVLVSQTRPRVERFTRQGDLWVLEEFNGTDPSTVLPLVSVDCLLPLAEVYAGVTFPDEVVTYAQLP